MIMATSTLIEQLDHNLAQRVSLLKSKGLQIDHFLVRLLPVSCLIELSMGTDEPAISA